MLGQHVSIGQIIRAQIDSEAPLIRVADPCDRRGVAVV
jgi:hypothetical protein